VNACIETLEKRRAWVVQRAGSAGRAQAPNSYDVREGIAIGYAVGMLKAAQRLDLVPTLEQDAIAHKQIHSEWVD
jgi:hypothetical protein